MTKKIISMALILILSIYSISQIAQAEDEVQKQALPTSSSYLWVKVKEFTKLNLFTWEKSSKIKVLGDFTDQRMEEMSYAESIDNTDAIELSLNRYQWQKTKELQYVQDVNDEAIMDQTKEQTLEQQREMTKLQLSLEDSGDLQKNVVEVQKNVANQTKEVVRIIEGEEGVTQVDIQTKYVWIDPNADASGQLPPLPDNAEKWEYAPGTSGRDTTGKIIDIQITSGTESSGQGESNVIIKEQTDTNSDSGSNKVINTTTESGEGTSSSSNVKVDVDQSP